MAVGYQQSVKHTGGGKTPPVSVFIIVDYREPPSIYSDKGPQLLPATDG